MFTGKTFGFILAAVVLFFLGSFTNVGWVRIVDAVLWGMLGLSLLLQWLSLTAVEAQRRLTRVEHTDGGPSPMEDDAIEVEVALANRRFWPRFFISVSYDAPMESPESRWQRFFLANLKGHGTVRLASTAQCYRRGLHHFGPVIIDSQVPFGLFRRRKRKKTPLSVLVYPRVYPMKRLALAEGALGASDQPRRARTGQDVIGSRRYSPGDPLRHIHWRNTDRVRELIVKELEDTTERALTVAFDVRQSIGEGRETTLEYSIKLAATIGLYVMSLGESIRLVAGGLQGEWAYPEPFLRQLAMIEPAESPALSTLLQTEVGPSPAIAIVAAPDEREANELAESLARLPRLAAVVLEGFGPLHEQVGQAEAIRRAGVPTVVCRQGNLAEAIAELQNAGLRSSPVAR